MKNILSTIVRKKKLSLGQKIGLIERRGKFLREYLRDISLLKLGEFKCICHGSVRDNMERDDPIVDCVPATFSLGTKGIFGYAYNSEYVERNPGVGTEYIKYFWGLTRNGTWILVKVYYLEKEGVKNTEEQALRVIISRAGLEEILEKTKFRPEDIMGVLDHEINKWAKSRKQLYEEARKVQETIWFENNVLTLLGAFD